MFVLPLALMGCVTWIDQEPACDQDIYSWSDDLLAFVLTGDGSGEFDFDPEDTPRTDVHGDYSPTTGDFSYKTAYDDAYYLSSGQAEGFGTVYHNGNLDVLYTNTVTDVLGAVFGTTWRVQRDACEMTIASWDADADADSDSALVRTGSYSDGTSWSWSADVPGYTWTGGLRQNLSRTEQIEADDGSYRGLTTSKPDGTATLEWSGDCSTYTCEGTTTTSFDGSTDAEYTAMDGDSVYAEATGTHAYDGSGVEHIVYHIDGDDIACDYTTDADGDCEYSCDDGEDGSCN
jgi:hypothetical protein